MRAVFTPPLGTACVSGGAITPAPARFSSKPDYDRYEREKLAFIVFNPNATPRQYEAAMKAIAKRCGI